MDTICLYCGRKQKTGYEDNQHYSYCTCSDFRLTEEITEQLRALDKEYRERKHGILARMPRENFFVYEGEVYAKKGKINE